MRSWVSTMLCCWAVVAQLVAENASESEPDYQSIENYAIQKDADDGALAEQLIEDVSKVERPPGLLPAEPVAYILGYHQFDRKNNRYSTTSAKLIEHLNWMGENGWEIISLERLVDFLEGGDEIPMKSVVITVDDGYRSVYERAWPILRQRKVPWSFFIYPDFIGVGGSACTWAQLREMEAQGVDMQNHSMSHAFLNKRGDRTDEQYEAFLRRELLESKEILQKQLKGSVWAHAYPYGAWNRHVRETAIGYGYRALLTVNPQPVTGSTEATSIGRIIISTDNEDSLPLMFFERTLGVEIFEPLPGGTARLPVSLVRGRILEPSAVKNVRLNFVNGQRVPLRYNPFTGEFLGLVPFAQQVGRLRFIIEAEKISDDLVLSNSWVVQCVEAPVAVPAEEVVSEKTQELEEVLISE